MLYIEQWIPPEGGVVHRPLGVGITMGSLMMAGALLGPIGTKVMAMDKG